MLAFRTLSLIPQMSVHNQIDAINDCLVPTVLFQFRFVLCFLLKLLFKSGIGICTAEARLLGRSCFCNGIFMLFRMMGGDFSWIYRTVTFISPKLLASIQYLT